jgi:signal transduction histidine kinase
MTLQKLTPSQFENLLSLKEKSEGKTREVTDSAFMRALASLDRDLLSTLLVEEKREPGTIIFREGEEGDTVYLIRSGQIAAVTGDLSAPTFLGCRGPGEVIGEMALLENRPRSASVIALEQVRLLGFDGEGFHRLLRQSPAASLSIMALLSSRLREAAIARNVHDLMGRKLVSQVSSLQTEKEELLELQRVRQETTDLIIHDLRNPLSLMYSAFQMLEMVLPKELVEANWELLDVVKTSHTRMRRLVDSLLDVARMDAGEAVIEAKTVSFHSVVEEAVAPARYSMKKRNIEYCVLIPEDFPKIDVDQDKMIRVVGNLVDNAVKYMPGGGKLTIAAIQKDDQLRFSVTDTGPGIPEKDRSRVFERFTQVSGSDRPRGFGLGLDFCRLTVEAHGGRIWVEAGDENIGCRFIFTLPMARSR